MGVGKKWKGEEGSLVINLTLGQKWPKREKRRTYNSKKEGGPRKGDQ